MQYEIWGTKGLIWVVKGEFLIWFSLKIYLWSLGFLRVKELIQIMRKCDIYRHQEQGKWKDNFAPEIARSVVSNGGQAVEWLQRGPGNIGDFVRRFRNRRSNRRIRPERLNASGLIGGFDSAARPPILTADSPKLVKPRRSQGHSPWAVFA